jgi:glycosyltransferase involved in cell wall biosynthesis
MKKTPVILQVGASLNGGGAEKSLVELAGFLKGMGWPALVAARRGRMEAELKKTGAKFYDLPLHKKGPITLISNAFALARIVKKEEVDLMHARSRGPAWSCWLASKLTGVPYITTFHGTHSLNGPLKKFYNSVMVRGVAVIANSNFIREHIATYYGVPKETITVAQRGVDMDFFNPDAYPAAALTKLRRELDLTKDTPIILIPGRITRWKGQDIALEALKQLTDLPWVALLVGAANPKNAQYEAELRTSIANSGLLERVRLLGHRTDLPALYKLSTLTICSPTSPEAFGRTQAESLAMGTPVVAAAHGGALEILTGKLADWLVPPADSTALAEKIRALLTSPALRKNLGRLAKQQTRQHFTIANTYTCEVSVYKNVLNLA